MKVVALCNKLTRSRTLLKDSEDPEAPDKPAAVVSNMTTGKTAEVRLFFRENLTQLMQKLGQTKKIKFTCQKF